MEDIAKLLGRLFIVLIFLSALIGKVIDFGGSINYMVANGITYMTELWLTGAITLLATGTLSLIIGIRLKWGATALLLFLVSATIIFHFDLSNRLQVIQLFKNVAIAGGLIMVMITEPGKFTLINYLKK